MISIRKIVLEYYVLCNRKQDEFLIWKKGATTLTKQFKNATLFESLGEVSVLLQRPNLKGHSHWTPEVSRFMKKAVNQKVTVIFE